MIMEIEAPTIDISKRSSEDQVKLLTKVYPNLAKDAESDCRQVITHYDMVIKGKFWRKVAASEEEYFLKYYKKPKSWFENIKEKLLLIPAATSPTLGDVVGIKPEGNQSIVTNEMKDKVFELRSEGKTQREIADVVGVSRITVGRVLKNNNVHNYYNCNSCEHSRSPKQQGNSAEYRQARLDRDHPELAQRVKQGEITLASACKEAKITEPIIAQFQVKERTQPQTLAKSMTERLPLEFINDLYSELGKLIQEHHNEHNWIP